MKIVFKQYQFEYLKQHLAEDLPDLFKKLQALQIGDSVFNIDDEVACSISDWAGDRLQRVGFEGSNHIIAERNTLDEIVDLMYS